jgi:uncharacterized protein
VHSTSNGLTVGSRGSGARALMNQGPVAAGQRIVALDILRGFALLGILMLNIEHFSGPSSIHDIPMGTAKPAFVGWHAPLDLGILTIKWLFFEGKMRTLFSMLYGAGIVLLAERFERKGQDGRAADIFARRNMWLLLFGLIHGALVWEGDILSQYALLALLFMFPLRHVSAKRLIVAGLMIGVIGGTIGVFNTVGVQKRLAAERLSIDGAAALAAHRPLTPDQAAALAAEAKARSEAPAKLKKRLEAGRAPYLKSVARRTNDYLDSVIALFRKGLVLEIIGSMLLGMGLFKSGFLTGEKSRSTYLATALVGYGICAPVVVVGVAMAHAQGFSPPAATRWMFQPYALQVFAGSIANAAVVLLLFKCGWFKPSLGALANVGRTAFSNYILTSLICQFVFGWGPWKLYGGIDYYQQIYFVVGVWTVNLVASALWLRAFDYGPLEWIWRSLVYWKRQPMRHQKRPA